MKKLEGKVAFITGAARGQGRAHSVRLAEEGAKIVAIDICSQMERVTYEMSSADDLAQTVIDVEAVGGEIMAEAVDVRDLPGLERIAGAAVERFGSIDIVIANAGISTYGRTWELTEELWQDTIDVNLTAVWKTVKATVPVMIALGRGGSIVFTSSSAAFVAIPTLSHYTAAKTGLVGLARSLTQELGEHFIRVNTIHPAAVETMLALNDDCLRLFAPNIENPTKEDVRAPFASMNVLPVPWMEPRDVSNTILWLVSDDARFVTGAAIPIDMGLSTKYPTALAE